MKMDFSVNEMSQSEKEILCDVISESDALPYEITLQTGSDDYQYEVYDIPESDICNVVRECYPFLDAPEDTDEILCVHEREFFSLCEAKIIRYRNRNIPVSKFFLQSGGTCIDWIVKSQES